MSLVRDSDPDEAAEQGIPIEPPDLERMDWEAVRRDLHNALVDAHLLNWSDLQRSQDSVLGIACRVVKRHLVQLFRMEDLELRSNGRQS